jgi:nitrate reductase gamma subunit
MSYLNDLLFGIYPYLAGAVFLVGSWVRYDREQYTWKTGSSQMLSSEGMHWASNLFHVGVLAIFFGHLVGLLTPHAFYDPFMSAGTKQVIAILIGGVAGVACLIGAALLLQRRLFNPRIRATSTMADILILVILMVQVTLGLFTIFASLGHLDGSVMLLLAGWAQGIVTFNGGAADYLLNVSFIYKLHIFLGMTIFLLFPFTRLVHVWSAPVKYLARSYQIVRQR